MILDKIFALEKRDEEQRCLIENLQEQMSSQQTVIQAFKMQLASQQAYNEKLETRLSAYKKTTNEVTVPSNDDIPKAFAEKSSSVSTNQYDDVIPQKSTPNNVEISVASKDKIKISTGNNSNGIAFSINNTTITVKFDEDNN